MAQPRTRKKASKAPERTSRPILKGLILVIILVAMAPSIHRGLWRWNERSAVGMAVKTVRDQGCLTCHSRAGVGYRWRGDGDSPQTAEAIRDALQQGRPAVPGMPGPMPDFATRVGAGKFELLFSGTKVIAGLVDLPDEAELRIGLTIAGEMGCFDCHGPMGAGGVANPGTVGGLVPGFFGASFVSQEQSTEGIEGVVRDGRAARRAWWTPWKRPSLDMPAYGDRLDSTEIALLVYAIKSLPAETN